MPDALLLAARHVFSLSKQIAAQNGLWTCAPIGDEPHGVRFVGWALSRHTAEERVDVQCDGRSLPLERCPAPDANVFLRFDRSDPHSVHGFSFVLPKGDWTEHEAVLQCRFGGASTPRPYYGYFFRRSSAPRPEVEHMRRTTGTTDGALFDFLGYTQLRHLEHLMLEYAGRTRPMRVLDWGCGAGRILRFARARWDGELHGADVDPVNVAWCRRHLSDMADFHQLALDPPMGLANASFDLVYGISVFTHLGEADQLAWLQELSRVTTPGGLVIVTIHGPTSFVKEVNDFWHFAELAAKGFWDYGLSLDLQRGFEESVHSGRYRNVFHTHRYVYENWSRFFEILDVIPGISVAHQDYVVMRRAG